MQYNYLEAISIGFPEVQVHTYGDGSTYEEIIWDSGIPLPSKQTLDEWIAANPKDVTEGLTKYQFRKLFTLNERVLIDNAQQNPAISDNNKAILATIMKDLEVSGSVFLNNPDTIQGVMFLEQIGLIAVGRSAQILANIPPS